MFIVKINKLFFSESNQNLSKNYYGKNKNSYRKILDKIGLKN